LCYGPNALRRRDVMSGLNLQDACAHLRSQLQVLHRNPACQVGHTEPTADYYTVPQLYQWPQSCTYMVHTTWQ
jgi:hypothetical protein